MGVAEALAGMREQLPGEVLFIFQPAEEGPPDGEEGGAESGAGVFRDFQPEAVFGLHVFSTLNAGRSACAPDRRWPHPTASASWSGAGRRTARGQGGIDPIVAAADIIGTTQTIVSRRQNISKLPVVVSFGAVKGGIRYNIIPDHVELVGTIHAASTGMRQAVFADLRNVADTSPPRMAPRSRPGCPTPRAIS